MGPIRRQGDCSFLAFLGYMLAKRVTITVAVRLRASDIWGYNHFVTVFGSVEESLGRSGEEIDYAGKDGKQEQLMQCKPLKSQGM